MLFMFFFFFFWKSQDMHRAIFHVSNVLVTLGGERRTTAASSESAGHWPITGFQVTRSLEAFEGKKPPLTLRRNWVCGNLIVSWFFGI